MHDVNELFEEAKTVLDLCNIPYWKVTSVTINTRAKNRWGLCKYSRITNTYSIEISRRLLADDVPHESALGTMVHELLHAHRNHMSHTGEWKRCAEIINKRFPKLNIKRCSSAAELGVKDEQGRAEAAKYIITCSHCGQKSYYMRKSRVVQLIQSGSLRCTCQRCGGNHFEYREVR